MTLRDVGAISLDQVSRYIGIVPEKLGRYRHHIFVGRIFSLASIAASAMQTTTAIQNLDKLSMMMTSSIYCQCSSGLYR